MTTVTQAIIKTIEKMMEDLHAPGSIQDYWSTGSVC